jgi:hypothetical protein
MSSTTPKADARRARRHADAVRALERAEKRLHRAFTAWSSARSTVRRYEAELGREFAARAASTSSPADDVFNDKLPPIGGQGE